MMISSNFLREGGGIGILVLKPITHVEFVPASLISVTGTVADSVYGIVAGYNRGS